MLMLEPNMEKLMQISINRMKSMVAPNGKRLSTSPGSINRLLLSVINENLHDFYKELKKHHLMAFLSTSEKEGLDLIGNMFNCKRIDNEDDTSYKRRISSQLALLESGNELAVRLCLLAVDGVDDVHLMRFTKGTGSFSAFITTDSIDYVDNILEACKTALEEKASYGIAYTVSLPDFVPVEIQIKIIMLNNIEVSSELKDKVREKVTKYINSRNIGEDIVINEIIQNVMETSDDIYDMEIKKMVINNKPVIPSNQSCGKYERFIESKKEDSISII